MNQGKMSGKEQSSNTLFYDKLRQHDEEKNNRGLFAICSACFKKKKENKVDAIEAEEKHEFAMSYADMQALLDELHSCQRTLKGQLKDLEKRKNKDNEEQEGKNKDEMAELIETLSKMALFVNENNEVVTKVLE